MKRVRKLQYSPEIQSIPKIRFDLDQLQQEWRLARAERHQLSLIIEELFSGLTRHRDLLDKDSWVTVHISIMKTEIVIAFTYDGFPFNPMDQRSRTRSGFTEEEDDGMGPDLVRAFASSIGYHLTGRTNHLEIRKEMRAKPEIATDE